MVEVERARPEEHREHRHDQRGGAEQDRERQAVAHQRLERAAGQHRPLGPEADSLTRRGRLHGAVQRGVRAVGAVLREALRPRRGRGLPLEQAVDLVDALHPEVRERLRDRPVEREVPVAREEDDAVAGQQVLHRVRGEHHRGAAVREPAQKGEQLTGAGGIQAGGRLVQEEDVGAREQLDRDARALALAARERAHLHIGALGEAERAECLLHGQVHLGRRGGRWHPQRRRVAQRALERQVGVDDVVLGDVAEQPPERVEVAVEVDAVEAHRPALRRTHARQRLQQRGLAGAAAADDRDELARADGERHAA